MDPTRDGDKKTKQPAAPSKPAGEMSLEQKKEFVKGRVAKGKINDCEPLIAADDTLFDFFIGEMSNNKNAKRASEIIQKYHKDFGKYPGLLQRLEKKAVRFMLGDQPWELVELRLRAQPDLLAIAAEDYFFQEKKAVAYTLVVRNDLRARLKKVELRAWLDGDEAKHTPLLENEIETKDSFGRGV